MIRSIIRVQLRILKADPWFLLIMFLMPLVVMPLLKKSMSLALADGGYENATGAEQVVPGQIVLFGFFIAGTVGFSIFREHGWKTWDRLRASAASPTTLLAGFAIPWIVIHVIWQAALFIIGGLWLGLRLNGGSPFALLLTLLAYSVCLVSIILLATTSFRTVQQLSALQNVGAMVFSGLGGAIVPVDQLPGWAQAVAPATPAYWTMKAHQSILLDGAGLGDVLPSLGVLFGMSVVFIVLAVRRFRLDETKEFFA